LKIGRILVTGSRGFLGRHAVAALRDRYGSDQVTCVSSEDYDLIDPAQARRMLEDNKPDVLLHLAGYVGGIGANRAQPADFFYRNIQMTTQVFEAAARGRVRKMIFTMGGCSYPGSATSPIGEEQMWNGYPQADSAAYSSAKKMGIVASHAYRQQYGLNSAVMVPGNVYGEYDNFRENESHVIPAMIRRFVEAKRQGVKEVVCWGRGTPVRDFVYVADVARAIPFFIESYDSSEPVNISSGTSTSIRELAETVQELTGYPGDIRWDTSKPEGQLVKSFDVTRMKQLGIHCDTSLRDGLQQTIRWFEANYHDRGDGLRL
jgi:GDP-L-fucose synthase